MSKRTEDFLDALDAFVKAADELNGAWDNLNADEWTETCGGEYPFKESFDEVACMLWAWKEAMHEAFED